ncbi:hypothetical protein OHA25_22675 [Nonomuraea sp. NBC_00507]|uniref:hypothetical protein n=1 Tax=Nonomuraea sp. NBC_00507 TaxID=2976002 RepID=UPI002E18477F
MQALQTSRLWEARLECMRRRDIPGSHFTVDTDAWLLATELDALAMATNLNATLHDHHGTLFQARSAALYRLRQVATSTILSLDEPEGAGQEHPALGGPTAHSGH